MDRLLTVLLGSLFTGGVALAAPGDARPVLDGPAVETYEVRQEFGRPRLGVQATELTPELQDFFGADGLGVLVSRVFEGSAAHEAGIAVGDVVVAVGGEPVASVEDLRAAVARADEGAVMVEVVRGGHLVDLTAELDERAPAFDRAPWPDAGPRVHGWDRPDATFDDREDFERLERFLEDLEERIDVEIDALREQLDEIEPDETGTFEVR